MTHLPCRGIRASTSLSASNTSSGKWERCRCAVSGTSATGSDQFLRFLCATWYLLLVHSHPLMRSSYLRLRSRSRSRCQPFRSRHPRPGLLTGRSACRSACRSGCRSGCRHRVHPRVNPHASLTKHRARQRCSRLLQIKRAAGAHFGRNSWSIQGAA